MHGSEHRNRMRWTLRLSAPPQPSFPAAGSMPQSAPLAPSRWSPILATAFRSPATAADSLGLHSGVKVPGLLLRLETCRLYGPFGSPLHRLSRFAPSQAASPLKPVAASATGPACRSPSLHSPLGSLLPFGSKRSAGSAARRLTFRTRPISLRSPQPLSIASVSAADHRSRSATFPEACCSSNLLEPSSICPRSGFRSTRFVPERAVFLNLFLLCFEWVTAVLLCRNCG
jgi:hypothetical protein